MNITIPGLLIINGLQGGGKSHLIKTIMYNNRKQFHWGLVFSNTSFKHGNFDYVSHKYVHEHYNESALLALVQLHRRLISEGKSPRAFVIFDDCLERKQFADERFQNLCLQLRHYGVFVIISTQYPVLVPSRFRANAFQAAMFYFGAEAATKALYQSYGNMFDNYAAFKKYLNEHTSGHQFVWYDARNGGRDVTTRYKTLQAPAKIPSFKIKFHKTI
jgi:hypothetical protein